MSKSQSKEFFKKKQRGRTKRNSIGGGGISIGGPTTSNVPKLYPFQTSHGSATGFLGNGEDPALVVINPHPPTLANQTKEKRTKICCLL
jgi:hypothetical protein